MKIFGELIKIVLISAMITGACFASGSGTSRWGIDPEGLSSEGRFTLTFTRASLNAVMSASRIQTYETMESLANIGFTSPTTLTFTQHAIKSILDSSFNPALGVNAAVRNIKHLLRGTVIEALSLTVAPSPEVDQRTAFQAALTSAFSRVGGSITIDITSLGYNKNLEPTALQISTAAQLLSDKITSLNTTAAVLDADEGMGLFD